MLIKQSIAAAAIVFSHLFMVSSWAQYDPQKLKPEPVVIAKQFPDPAVRYDSPSLSNPQRKDFASHEEVMRFLRELSERKSTIGVHTHLEIIGQSQAKRDIPLLRLGTDAGFNSNKPTVLIIGQQHGNEPASGEAVLALASVLTQGTPEVKELLNKINILLVPRANPDGAEKFARTTLNGQDVNRDHLLLRTPEGQALAQLQLKYPPQVVLDLHEFTVGDRWVAKFGAYQKYDVLLQGATVGNLTQAVQQAQEAYLSAIRKDIAAIGQSSFAYHTSSPAALDKTVVMGGVNADTGRNVSGLKHAVSLLIETRGVGLGRAHLLRRVHAHVTAAMAVLRHTATAVNLSTLAAQEHSSKACSATVHPMSITAAQSESRMDMVFLDAVTGEDKAIQADWRSATERKILATRPLPCGYIIAAKEHAAIALLKQHGVAMRPATELLGGQKNWPVEAYEITALGDGKRQDGRGAIDFGAAFEVMTVRLQAAQYEAKTGDVFVPMQQALAAFIMVALEPDSQNGLPANRLLNIKEQGLLRVMQLPK